MPSSRIQDLVAAKLEEDEEEDLRDFVSEGEGDAFDDLEPPIELDRSFPTCVLIANVPKVNKAKYEKLNSVLKRLISKHTSSEHELHHPMDEETGETHGMAIVRYNKQEDAEQAMVLDGVALDKAHTFKVMTLDNFDKIMNRRETFAAKSSVSWFTRRNFRDWLGDDHCREQFLLRYHDQTEIYWHDTLAGQPQLVYGGEREKEKGRIWCDWIVQWSPQGSYICTFHKQGLMLWAGPDFQRVTRIAHQGVQHAEFSPTEEYILTWNGSHPSENDTGAVRIHRIQGGEHVFGGRTPVVAPKGGEFPHYLWSNDGKYFAECDESRILIRDTETFQLLRNAEGKKRNFKFDNLASFEWSPKDNIMAVWVLEKNNNPARLVLVEVPSLNEITSRSRTQVEAEMFWQSEGDFLCLKVIKVSRQGKKQGTNLEIFRLRERGVPVDNVELKETVRGFFWESKGKRFGLMTTDENGHKPKVQLYVLSHEKCECTHHVDLPGTSFSQMYWAPDGRYFVVAAIGHGDLLFASANEANKLDILHKEEHFMVTDVRWSPCSRYVITAVCADMQAGMGGFKYQQEAGFRIWTFQGRSLVTQQKEKLYSVQWRPHPPSLLSPAKIKEVRGNIRQLSKRFDAMDDRAKEQAKSEFRREREDKMTAFMEVVHRLRDLSRGKSEENGWAEAYEELQGEQEWEKVEHKEETELDTQEELISA